MNESSKQLLSVDTHAIPARTNASYVVVNSQQSTIQRHKGV